jgi:hypothetical protein
MSARRPVSIRIGVIIDPWIPPDTREGMATTSASSVPAFPGLPARAPRRGAVSGYWSSIASRNQVIASTRPAFWSRKSRNAGKSPRRSRAGCAVSGCTHRRLQVSISTPRVTTSWRATPLHSCAGSHAKPGGPARICASHFPLPARAAWAPDSCSGARASSCGSPLTAGGIHTALASGWDAAQAIADHLQDAAAEPGTALARAYPRFLWKRSLRVLFDHGVPDAVFDALLGTRPFSALARTVYFHHRGFRSADAWRDAARTLFR